MIINESRVTLSEVEGLSYWHEGFDFAQPDKKDIDKTTNAKGLKKLSGLSQITASFYLNLNFLIF